MFNPAAGAQVVAYAARRVQPQSAFAVAGIHARQLLRDPADPFHRRAFVDRARWSVLPPRSLQPLVG